MTLLPHGRARSSDKLKHISTTTVPMATKLGRLLTCLEHSIIYGHMTLNQVVVLDFVII